jgi:transcriptional regulator with XRE-family HTH domain
MLDGTRKLFVGPRLKRLRRERHLSQSRMAEDLEISPSYLNLMERNQRPITAQVLIRLANAYSLDPREFATDHDERATSELEEVFADRCFDQLLSLALKSATPSRALRPSSMQSAACIAPMWACAAQAKPMPYTAATATGPKTRRTKARSSVCAH